MNINNINSYRFKRTNRIERSKRSIHILTNNIKTRLSRSNRTKTMDVRFKFHRIIAIKRSFSTNPLRIQ